MTLDTVFGARFVPGSNVKGDVVGANWRFLLPSLELDRVVALGDLTVAARAALGQGGADVVGEREARSLPPGSVDLVVVSRGAASRLERDPGLERALARLLSPSGLAWIELPRPEARLQGDLAQVGSSFRLTPPAGEIHGAAPRDDPGAARFLRRLARDDSGVRRTPPDRIKRALRRHPLHERLRPRYGVLASSAGRPRPLEGLPAYVLAVAAEAGVDLGARRFALATPGRYSSKKVLFFVFEEGDVPTAVVKLTRDPAFSARLENEHRALTRLGEREVATGTWPRPLFCGHHAGLALAGQTVVEGVPLVRAGRAGAGSPWLRGSLDFLAELAETTADPRAATPAEVANGLRDLLDQYAEIYRPAAGELSFLAGQIGTIAAATSLPLVFQHGDPGTWNALAAPARRVAFLDWEAAAPEGMPLWDILYFARSYSTLSGGRGRGLLGDKALRDTVAATIERHRDRIGLAAELVEPLFYTCWMHRALKESTRLRPEQLRRSNYATFLRRCIERRAEPELRALLSPARTG